MRPVLSGWVNAPPILSSWLAQCSEMSGAMRPVLSGWLNAPGLSGGFLSGWSNAPGSGQCASGPEWLEQCAQFSVAGSNPVNALGLSEGSEAVNGSSPVLRRESALPTPPCLEVRWQSQYFRHFVLHPIPCDFGVRAQ